MSEGTGTKVIGKIGQDELFTRYLLGDLTEQERARLEEEYFTDDDAFEHFLVVKGELLDSYARGEMSGRERELFERHFLSTGPRRRSLGEATELIEFSTEAAARMPPAAHERGTQTWSSLPPALSRLRTPYIGFALAAVLAVAALGGLWAFFTSPEPRSAEQQRAADTPPAPQVTSARQPESAPPPNNDDAGATVAATRTPPIATAPDDRAPVPVAPVTPAAPARRPPAATTRVASVLLTPLLTRGDAGRANTLVMRPGASAARLRLAFRGGDYRRYVAVLQTIEGGRVWSGAASRAEMKGEAEIVVVNVPAGVFSRKDYIVSLSGVTAAGETQEINEYFLTVSQD